MHITIIGAHGQIGQRLVRRLAALDHTTARAMIRDESQQSELEALGAETVIGDLEREFEHAFDGTDAVVFTAGSGGGTGLDKTLMIDLWGARRAVDAAVAKGVDRFVMVSSMGTRDPLAGPEDLRPYLVAKRAADDHLRATSLTWTVVRPGMLTDDEGTGRVTLAPQVEPGRIPRDDVAGLVVTCLVEGLGVGRTFEAVSGETTIRDALGGLTG